MQTISDLLRELQENSYQQKTLENNAETWGRIGENDDFPELNLSSSDLTNFLNQWIKENSYS